MSVEYPNLELIEYKAIQIATRNEKYLPDFDFYVFPQIWGSTCTGFDLTANGEPAISGCAMTKAYTTVVRENKKDIYIIFFGNEPCYEVANPKEEFFEDLEMKWMAPLSEAQNKY